MTPPLAGAALETFDKLHPRGKHGEFGSEFGAKGIKVRDLMRQLLPDERLTVIMTANQEFLADRFMKPPEFGSLMTPRPVDISSQKSIDSGYADIFIKHATKALGKHFAQPGVHPDAKKIQEFLKAAPKPTETTGQARVDLRSRLDKSQGWDKLPKAAQDAIYGYTDDTFLKINGLLRHKDGIGRAEWTPRIKAMEGALRPAPQDLLVWRNAGTSAAKVTKNLGKLKPGTVFADPGFASTTLDGPGTSKGIWGMVRIDTPLLEITVPKGTPVLYPGTHSATSLDDGKVRSEDAQEHEVILKPGQQMVVTGVRSQPSGNGSSGLVGTVISVIVRPDSVMTKAAANG